MAAGMPFALSPGCASSQGHPTIEQSWCRPCSLPSPQGLSPDGASYLALSAEGSSALANAVEGVGEQGGGDQPENPPDDIDHQHHQGADLRRTVAEGRAALVGRGGWAGFCGEVQVSMCRWAGFGRQAQVGICRWAGFGEHSWVG